LRGGSRTRSLPERAATTSETAPTSVLSATTNSPSADPSPTTESSSTESPPTTAAPTPVSSTVSTSGDSASLAPTPTDPPPGEVASPPPVIDDATWATLTVNPTSPEPGQLMTLMVHVHNRRADTAVAVVLNPGQVLQAGANDCHSSEITAIDQDVSF